MNIYKSERYDYRGYEIETFSINGGFYGEVRGRAGEVIARFPKCATRDAAKGESETHVDYLLETHHV